MHQSAEVQVTGEAEYADDIAKPVGMLHAALVLSTVPHGKILDIDPAAALATPGVHGFFSAKDVPNNVIGPAVLDEEVFASEYVTCVGHPVGIVVADTQDIALEASRLVRVKYETLPAILNLDEAVAADSYHTWPGFTDHGIEDGDVDVAMAECEAAGCVVEGDARCGGQEHFYLEPMVSLVWCGDNDDLITISSTQAPQKHQKLISSALKIPCNRVVCKTKRLGGGFGGKETRAAFLNVCAAIPAFHMRKPISLVLDRHIDMAITGQRHAFLGKYKVGYSPEGKILALDMMLYNNAGNSLDLSAAIMDRRFSQRRRVQDPQRAGERPVLQDEPAVQHRVPRVRRSAGRDLCRDVDGQGGEKTGPARGEDSTHQPLRGGRDVPLRPEDGIFAASRVLGRGCRQG